jgi:hypothetical protein
LKQLDARERAAALVRRTYWGEIQIFAGGEGESGVAGGEGASDVAGGEGAAVVVSSATSTPDT